MIDPTTGKHVDNITCPKCKFRHPAAWSCGKARAVAQSQRPAPEPEQPTGHTGELLYQVYVEKMASQGVEVDGWYALDDTDQAAWQAVADHVLRSHA